jgi:protein-S-isoprenylcysteine O-methyltransferase Ste14
MSPDLDEPLDLFSQQERNRSRSRWLVVAFVLFFAWLGFGGDWIAYMSTRDAEPEAYHHVTPWFGIFLTTLGAGIATWSWKRGPDAVVDRRARGHGSCGRG